MDDIVQINRDHGLQERQERLKQWNDEQGGSV